MLMIINGILVDVGELATEMFNLNPEQRKRLEDCLEKDPQPDTSGLFTSKSALAWLQFEKQFPDNAALRSPESELIPIDGTGFASGKTNHFFASLGALSDEERKGLEFTLSTTGHCKNCHCQTPHDQDICDDCINPDKPI